MNKNVMDVEIALVGVQHSKGASKEEKPDDYRSRKTVEGENEGKEQLRAPFKSLPLMMKANPPLQVKDIIS